MSKFSKRRVGLFLLGGFVMFAIGLFLIGDRQQLFSENVELYTEFADLAGLQNGATVRVAGMSAGQVLEIRVPPGPESRFRVQFRIVEDLLPIVREDSRATIQTDGIVGNKFLQIDAGSGSAAPVSSGATIPSEEPFEFADLVEQARGLVETVGTAVDEVLPQVQTLAKDVTEIAGEAKLLVAEVRPDLEAITGGARAITEDVDALLVGIREGRGTVGKLFTDEQMYTDVRATMTDFKQIATNVRQTTAVANDLLREAKEREVVAHVDQTVANVRDITGQAKELLASFQAEDDPATPDLMQDVRTTMAYARETLSDFSESSEALKRNWFFRGFFKDRGYYDLNEISVANYKAGVEKPGVAVGREWLHAQNLFEGEPGKEKLTEAGARAIDRALADILEGSRDNPLMVEGYGTGDTSSDAFLISQRRATVVRDYLIQTYLLRPNLVGIMQMGAVSSRTGEDPWQGVALVRFISEKEKKKQEKRRRNNASD